MKTTILTFAIALRCACGVQAQAHQAIEKLSEGLVIRNVTIISPERAEALRNGNIVITGDRIVSVGAEKPAGSLKNYEIINGDGLFVIPGLIDSHVHLAEIPGMPPMHQEKMPDIAEAYRKQLPRSYLYFGFTTLIDLNVIDRAFINRIKQAEVHPDIYDCACALVLANGYPMNYFPPEARFDIFPNFICDSRQADQIPAKFKPEDHSPAAAVKRVKDAGGICVKTHFEPGFGPFRGKLPTMTKEMATDIIAASHRQNLPVIMHANSYQAHQFATQAGADIVAHGLWNWGEHDNEEKIPLPIRQVLDEIVAKKIGFMATTQVMAGLRAMFDSEFLNDPNLQAVLPTALIEWYKSPEGRWFARELQKDFDGLEEAIIYRRFDFMVNRCRQVVQYLAQHDANLLLGSDTPSAPTYGNPPGYNGYLELKHLAESGVTLRQILQAATINNAKAFHLENSYGTIQSGKVANLLLLKKNPLETVEAYDAIATVVLRGKVLPRTTLSANSPQGESADHDHPLIRKVKAYRQANAEHDTARVQALLAKGAARWYEKKEGPGTPIKPAGKGPWSDWDEYFKGKSEIESYKVDSNQVTIRLMEINDYYRLIERGPAPTNLTYYFNQEGKITGILVFRDATPIKDRYEEFEQWAKKNRPADLPYLRPEGEIIPTLDRAKKWRAVLNEWRRSIGLPAIE